MNSNQSTSQDQATIRKEPNVTDLRSLQKNFSWKLIRDELNGLPGGKGLNIAYEAVDRHANSSNPNKVAIRWIGKEQESIDITYKELKEESNRFANVLDGMGIQKGDAVFSLLGRKPELYIAAMGTLKTRAIFCPLFSAFGPEPIAQRLGQGKGKVLVTEQHLYEKQVQPILEELPDLKVVLLIDNLDGGPEDWVFSYSSKMEKASKEYHIPETSPEDPALMHFTSGTTGPPKGALHVHNAVLTHYMTGKYVLDFHSDDIFWCTADPGWVTGTSYGIISPLCHGITNVVDEAEFNAERWFPILEREKVDIWYTAPTAIRRLMQTNTEPLREYDLSRLRLILSVGEPLNPEAIAWGRKKLNLTIKDTWCQTETGGIMIANFPAITTKQGSMGFPLPGIEAKILEKQEDGTMVPVEEQDETGNLALKKGWPSMFRGYLNQKEKYKDSFYEDWYITKDLAKKDEDGYFWFVGRSDDIIKTSGHMVGPFEVESVLMEHEAVAEAAVIGIPEPTIGQIVKAFVVLKPAFEASNDLKREIIGFARKSLGSAVAPKELEFKDDLPKNKSGKIMRRLLKARDLGEPEGDSSTLEK